MANYVKRPIKEDGVVLSKNFKKQMESFTNSNGQIVGAQPDRYILTTMSSYEFTQDNGFKDPTLLEYKVEKSVFDKAKYGSKVEVVYELVNGNTKPITLTLKN